MALPPVTVAGLMASDARLTLAVLELAASLNFAMAPKFPEAAFCGPAPQLENSTSIQAAQITKTIEDDFAVA